jgi:hypothetical protein
MLWWLTRDRLKPGRNNPSENKTDSELVIIAKIERHPKQPLEPTCIHFPDIFSGEYPEAWQMMYIKHVIPRNSMLPGRQS